MSEINLLRKDKNYSKVIFKKIETQSKKTDGQAKVFEKISTEKRERAGFFLQNLFESS